MAAAGASGGSGEVARLRMMCSHGGRFLPCGPHGAIRYVGGETRVLVLPRSVSFRELAAKLGEMEVGKIVSAVRYRLADDDGVLVSVTCDEELSHLRDDYDRLKATRPSASFRVFFSGQRRAASGRPPLPPKMRRVQSAPAVAAPARAGLRCGACRAPRSSPGAIASSRAATTGATSATVAVWLQPPPRTVSGAVAGASGVATALDIQERAKGARQEPAPEAATSKNSRGANAEGQEPADVMAQAKATTTH